VDARRCGGGRDADTHEERLRNDPERHAESAVDQLRDETDRDEGNDVAKGELADAGKRQNSQVWH
jgi:hypothetical protein